MTTPASTTLMVVVRIFGTTAQLTVDINDAERDRRTRAGLDALTDLAMLDGLLNLPLGWPVNIADLTDTERRLVARLPDSAVEHRALTDATVIRRVQPVLRMLDATVRAHSWRIGLARVSRLAPYCPRSLVLRGELSDSEQDQACLECCYYSAPQSCQLRARRPIAVLIDSRQLRKDLLRTPHTRQEQTRRPQRDRIGSSGRERSRGRL